MFDRFKQFQMIINDFLFHIINYLQIISDKFQIDKYIFQIQIINWATETFTEGKLKQSS